VQAALPQHESARMGVVGMPGWLPWGRRSAPRIAMVGAFHRDAGATNALRGYIKAARGLGYDVRASSLGKLDPYVAAKLPVAGADWKPDLMVLVFESAQFLAPERLSRIERLVPRSRRVVIDQDGMYSPMTVAGSDANHPTPESRAGWVALFDRLTNRILQPCVGQPPAGVERFLFFGLDRSERVAERRLPGPKPFDVVYVGSNWHRWDALVRLFDGLASVRSRLGRIAIFGKWWLHDTHPRRVEQTSSDPVFLSAHGVEVYPAVPFYEVHDTMGQGRLSPIFVRPVLGALGLVTPRMFETFAAATVPLLPTELGAARLLYGPTAEPLQLPTEPAATILEMLERYDRYWDVAREVGEKLAAEHSYEARLAELLAIAG
jgi:hypothetical protein